MSLLSDVQGRPERVHSLLKLLVAHGGRLPKTEIKAWLSPPARGDAGVAVDQTIGCARSLGFVTDDGRDVLALTIDAVPDDSDAFGDLIHQQLCQKASPTDRVMFETYAILLSLSQKYDFNWIGEKTIKELSDHINGSLDSESEEMAFNSTKYAPWRAWMIYLGLLCQTDCLPAFFPQPATRIERELPALGKALSFDSEIKAKTFLEHLSRRMPYIDGGDIYIRAARKLKIPITGPLTSTLSDALRSLDDEGALQLKLRGDAVDAVQLTQDKTYTLQAFNSVMIKKRHT